jgi:hypothetical protein
MSEKEGKPKYILVRKSAAIAICITFLIMLIASLQYTNWVDRRSNGAWCGIVVLFNDTYKQIPPPTETGKVLQKEFIRLDDKFKCT